MAKATEPVNAEMQAIQARDAAHREALADYERRYNEQIAAPIRAWQQRQSEQVASSTAAADKRATKARRLWRKEASTEPTDEELRAGYDAAMGAVAAAAAEKAELRRVPPVPWTDEDLVDGAAEYEACCAQARRAVAELVAAWDRAEYLQSIGKTGQASPEAMVWFSSRDRARLLQFLKAKGDLVRRPWAAVTEAADLTDETVQERPNFESLSRRPKREPVAVRLGNAVKRAMSAE